MLNIVMNNLFHTGEVHQCEITFNARYGTSNAKFIDKRVEKYFKELMAAESTKTITAS